MLNEPSFKKKIKILVFTESSLTHKTNKSEVTLNAGLLRQVAHVLVCQQGQTCARYFVRNSSDSEVYR